MITHPLSRRVGVKFAPWLFILLAFAGYQSHAQTNCQYTLNLNFNSGTRVGMAATWNWIDDSWNVVPAATNVLQTYTYSGGGPTVDTLVSGTVTNLLWADGSNSTAVVYVTNLTQSYSGVYSADAMLDTYLGITSLLVQDYDECFNEIYIYSDPKVVLNNLPTNTYDLYLYAVGPGESGEDQGFKVKIGNGSLSGALYTSHPGFEVHTNWTDGVQYVKFTNLTVNTGEDLVIELQANVNGNHLINGLQLIQAGGGPTNAPTPTISPATGTYTNSISVSITNGQPDTTLQYKFLGSSWVTYTGPFTLLDNSTIIAQASRHGNLDSALATNVFTFADTDGDGIADSREINTYGTDPQNPDSDYDGRLDGQELTDGTSPTNSLSVTFVRLGYWKFSDTDWWGEDDQAAQVATNLQNVASWDGNALLINSTNVARLKYKDEEATHVPNINLRNGTLSLWFKPDWGSTNSGGSGPGVWSRLAELGAYSSGGTYGQWVLGFNTEGTELLFSTQGGGNETNHVTASVSISSNTWRQVVLTYTPTNSILYLDGVEVANGPGVTFYPDATVRASDGINVGSDRDGTQQAKGMIDELETFNYPLDASTIYADYESVAGRDTDGDGVSDIKENENNTDGSVSDLPFSVQITYPRQGSNLP